VTVNQIIEFLREHYQGEQEVLLAKDSEGNDFKPVALEVCSSFYRINGRDVDLIDEPTEGFTPCAILWPGDW
jgi:hypothetical protein